MGYNEAVIGPSAVLSLASDSYEMYRYSFVAKEHHPVLPGQHQTVLEGSADFVSRL